MKHRVWILAVVILVGSAAVVRAQARMDEASLTAAHEALVVGVKTANLTMLQAMIHPRGLGFFRESQLPIQLGADFTAGNVLPAVVADLGRFMAVPTQTIYRVVGQVGVVMMTALLGGAKGVEGAAGPLFSRDLCLRRRAAGTGDSSPGTGRIFR